MVFSCIITGIFAVFGKEQFSEEMPEFGDYSEGKLLHSVSMKDNAKLDREEACTDSKREKLAAAFRTILECVADDVNRPGLEDTPMRAAKAMEFLTGGYALTTKDAVGSGVFEEGTENNMVIVKDIDISSLCEHHLLPFTGKAHIGYIVGPSRKVLGLSKLARIANMYARRLQVQERLTMEIAAEVQKSTECHGVAVLVEASHMCMVMRGVQQPGSSTTTSHYTGILERDISRRQEFLSMVTR